MNTDGTIKVHDNKTIIENNLKQYNVTYEANVTDDSVTGVPEDETWAYNYKTNVPNTVPTREGYTFTGWNTQADGKGTAYAAGSEIQIKDNVTLYAQWEEVMNR